MAVKDVKELTVYDKAYSVEFRGRQDIDKYIADLAAAAAKKAIDEYMANHTCSGTGPAYVVPTVVHWPDGTSSVVGSDDAHPKYAEASLKLLAAKSLYVYGPAGGGKSHFAMQFAVENNLPYYYRSVCRFSLPSHLVGSISPVTGEFFSTPLVDLG